MSERCPTCGRHWWPSMNASESFPGSACDLGECLCGSCENGDDCEFHYPRARNYPRAFHPDEDDT